MSTSISRLTEPAYYHREYSNDIRKKDSDNAWIHQAQRAALVALPFISLYKPLSFPLSLATGSMRAFTSIAQLLENMRRGDSYNIPYAMVQTAISVIAVVGTIFAHPFGMVISTTHDLSIEIAQLIDNLKAGQYPKAMEHCLNVVNNALYLALFINGGLGITIASLGMQILIGLYHSQAELKRGRYLEATGHLCMSMIRGRQLSGHLQILQTKQYIRNSLSRFDKQEEQRIEKAFLKSSSVESKNQIDVDYSNLLIQANIEKKEELVGILIKYGKNPNNIPALHYAVKQGDLEAAKLLLSFGANANFSARDSITKGFHAPMWYAIESMDIRIVELLFSYGAELNNQAVFRAVHSNFLKGLDFLLDNGAPSISDGTLYVYMDNEKISNEIIKSLVRHCIDCKFMYGLRLAKPEVEFVGLLSGAVPRGDLELISLLIEKGAPINFCMNEKLISHPDQYTINLNPLYCALVNQREDIANYLILKGAIVSDTHQKWFQNNFSIYKASLLLKLDLLDKQRIQHFFDLAIKLNQINEAKNLFNSGAAVNRSHLIEASQNGNKELIDWLLEVGAPL